MSGLPLPVLDTSKQHPQSIHLRALVHQALNSGLRVPVGSFQVAESELFLSEVQRPDLRQCQFSVTS